MITNNVHRMPSWSQADSIAFGLGFHVVTRNEAEITLAPARALFDVASDAPDFICIRESGITLFEGDSVVEHASPEKKPLLQVLLDWAADYAATRQAPRAIVLAPR